MFEALVEKKFKSIRLSINWHNHLSDNNYTIDPEWIKRVKNIVDWAIKHGLYVIINSQDNAQNLVNAMKYRGSYYPSP